MYDFNFDEMTIGDFVILGRVIAKPQDTAALAAFIEIIPKFTNTNVMALPFTETSRVIAACCNALSVHMNETKQS